MQTLSSPSKKRRFRLSRCRTLRGSIRPRSFPRVYRRTRLGRNPAGEKSIGSLKAASNLMAHKTTMARSQLPCPLFLLCSLLMLPSVLLQEVGMPGGLSPISVTSEAVQQAAAFAVEQYNERNGKANYFKELRIVKAQSQVVSGMKYYLQVEMGKTVCEKSSGPMPFSDIQKCELPPSNQQEKLTCNFQVWSRPWLKDTQLTSMNCS